MKIKMINWIRKAAKFSITLLIMLVVEIMVAAKIDYGTFFRKIYFSIVRVLKGILK